MVSTPVSIAAVIADVSARRPADRGHRVRRARAATPCRPTRSEGPPSWRWFGLVFVLAKQGFFETTQATTLPPRIGAGDRGPGR